MFGAIGNFTLLPYFSTPMHNLLVNVVPDAIGRNVDNIQVAVDDLGSQPVDKA